MYRTVLRLLHIPAGLATRPMPGGSSHVHLEVGSLAPQHSGRGVREQVWTAQGQSVVPEQSLSLSLAASDHTFFLGNCIYGSSLCPTVRADL